MVDRFDQQSFNRGETLEEVAMGSNPAFKMSKNSSQSQQRINGRFIALRLVEGRLDLIPIFAPERVHSLALQVQRELSEHFKGNLSHFDLLVTKQL